MTKKSTKRPAAPHQKSRPAKLPAVAKQRRAAAPVRAAKTSKTQTIAAALQRPDGATLADLVAVTGWQAHSIRGFLSGLRQRGVGVTRTAGPDGGHSYRAVPDGN
jgi:hypothetical protein